MLENKNPQTLTERRQIASETIEILKDFLRELAGLSQELGQVYRGREHDQELLKVMDGIHALLETVATIKSVLELQTLEPAELLVSELIGILKKLKIRHDRNDVTQIRILLKQVLPEHLYQWMVSAIPTISENLLAPSQDSPKSLESASS